MNNASQKELATAEYWEKRYADDSGGKADGAHGVDNYEWFKTYDKLKPFLHKHLLPASSNPRILRLGCGTSTLTADFFQGGYHDQVNIDFSPSAIKIMESRYENLRLEWRVMDVREMAFDDDEFDVANDKGTLDAMLHGSLWDPEDDVKVNVGKYVHEVARILKPGGRWLYVTYRQPHFLKPLLAREHTWTVQVESLEDTPGSFEYFGFIITKDCRT